MNENDETCCSRAHHMVTSRQGAYGSMGKSWQEIGQIADLITSPAMSPGERACKVLIAMKLVRMKNSPSNQDHYDDLAGYAEVAWQTYLGRPGRVILEEDCEWCDEGSKCATHWQRVLDAQA